VTIRKFVKDFNVIVFQNTAQKAVQLGKGQCPNMEEYKKVVGWISGMEAAAELAKAMLTQLEEIDSDAISSLPEMKGDEP
jgi:hypothetical protein